jgi:hypothetical protein
MTPGGSSCGGGGNTISPPTHRVNASIKWCFTWNNYDIDLFNVSMSPKLYEKCRLFIVGDEIGSLNNVKHLQGYIEFKKKQRPLELFNFTKNIHWEKAKGDLNSNINYCSKEKVLLSYGLPEPKPIPKPIKIIEKLYDWQIDIENYIKTEPDDRTIRWYYSDEGNIGKSQFCKYAVVNYKCLYCSGGKYNDIMNLVFNQNMDETNCVIFDLPRCHKGAISYASLESIKNGLVCNTKYETGSKVFNSPHIIIFANFPPENIENLSIDRWQIFKYTNNTFVKEDVNIIKDEIYDVEVD